MKKLMIDVLRDSLKGALAGIAISLTFLFTVSQSSLTPIFLIQAVLFGITIGILISFVCSLFARTLSILPARFQRWLIFPDIIFYYLMSVAIFYEVTVNFGIFFSLTDFSRDEIFYISLGVGVVSVMTGLLLANASQIEERLRLEKSCRELAVLEERNRIARELHDSVSQNLFGINLTLSSLDSLLEHDPEQVRRVIGHLKEMVGDVQTEMRLMIYGLRPPALAEKGFFEAVESLANLYKTRYNLNLVCQIRGSDERISEKTQLALYRILQEALNNIVKHSRATKAAVELKRNAAVLVLTVRDNGGGFDTASVQSGHLGLEMMRERARQNQGEFSISSVPGSGTEISIRIHTD